MAFRFLRMVTAGRAINTLSTILRLVTFYSVKRVSERGPLVLRIEITNRCNLNCVMCDRGALSRKPLNMEMDLFKKIIEEAVLHNIPVVGLNRFGEPTIHPQLIDMVQYTKNKGIKHLSFTTNATLLNEKLARPLLESQCLDAIACSIDGNSPETFTKIRRGADFEEVANNVENLVRIRNEMGLSKPKIQINTILTKLTETEIRETIKRWKNLVDNICVIPFKEYGNLKGNNFGSIDIKSISRKACPMLAYMLVAYADGGAGVCCVGDPNEEIKVGDFKSQTIGDIWNGMKINNVRYMHFKKDFSRLPMCEQCDLTYPITHWFKYYLYAWYKRFFG